MNGLIVRLKATLLVLLLLSSSIVTLVLADWGTIPVIPGVSVYEPGQKAIIAWNGQEEILILSADVASTANTTVLQILPLPSNPMKIEEASLESFYVVEELIWYHMPPPPPWGYLGNETDEVNVVFHDQIGMHDITVVEAYNVSEFAEWMEEFLLENGISQQVSLADFNLVIEDYMLRDFHFFVLDLLDLSSDQRSVEPILYKFETSFLYYPLLITSPIGGNGKIILFLITEGVIEKGYHPLRKAQYYGPDILELIQFEISNEELFLIDPSIGELFEDKAWLTALTYEGPLDRLTEDIMITLPRELLPTISFFPHEIYLDEQTNDFTVNVNIENLQASHRFVGCEMWLEYDTEFLNVTEAIEGEFLEDFPKLIPIPPIPFPTDYYGILITPPWTRFPEGNGTLVAFRFTVSDLPDFTVNLTSKFATPEGDAISLQNDYCHLHSIWNKADLNHDEQVNVLDLSVFALAFATHPGQYRWNTNVDLDRNQVINIIDAAIIAKNSRQSATQQQ